MNLTFPLSPDERATLYFHFGKLGAFCDGENLDSSMKSLTPLEIILTACEESRFDPRLMGVLIDFFARHYHRFNPFQLADKLGDFVTPETLGVISEFSMRLNPNPDLKAFFTIVLRKLNPVSPQHYFNSQTRPRISALLKEIIYTPREFRKWGFYSQMDPYLKEFRPRRSPWTYTYPDRQAILQDLFSKKPRIAMRDYLQALGGSISRQQAFKDIKMVEKLYSMGKNKGRRYGIKRGYSRELFSS